VSPRGESLAKTLLEEFGSGKGRPGAPALNETLPSRCPLRCLTNLHMGFFTIVIQPCFLALSGRILILFKFPLVGDTTVTIP